MTAHPLFPLLLCVAAYLVGGVPFGYLVGRMKGVDVRKIGSGNIGATNVLRTLGVAPGVTVLLLDALKGYLPVLAAHSLLAANPYASWWIVAVGLFAVLGHTYTPYLGFNGGKGVATALGVVIGLNPAIAGIAVLLFVAIVAATRYVSLGSIAAAVACAALFWFWPHETLPARLFIMLVAAFVVLRHRKNIERLRQGTESRFGKPKPPVEETTAKPA